MNPVSIPDETWKEIMKPNQKRVHKRKYKNTMAEIKKLSNSDSGGDRTS